jgi:uncharacterized repeat protein (TIGR01451 family)
MEIDWLRCCPSGDIVTVEKTGRIDANETNVVLYAITVENVGDGAAAAVVTDTLPDGMVLLEAEPEFASLDSGLVTWNLVELMPKETRTITYQARAQVSGRVVNRVRVDANLVDGSGRGSVYASSVVEVGEFEAGRPRPGWQPPDWGFNYTGYAADMTCEEICELS